MPWGDTLGESGYPYRDPMFPRFALYGFLKNLRFYEPFMVLYFLSLGFSYTEIGVLVSIQMVSTTLIEIPSGVYADVFGRKKALLLSFSSYIAAFLTFYFFRAFLPFAVAMFLLGLGDAFRTGTHKALILGHLRIKGILDRKVDYYGHTRAFSQLGSAINSMIAAALVFFTGDYGLVFLVATVPYLADMLNIATYPKYLDLPYRPGNKKESGDRYSRRETLRARFASLKRDFVLMLSNRDVWRGVFNSSAYDGGFEVAKHYLQPILKAVAIGMPVFLYLDGRQRVAVVVGVVYFALYLLTSLASSKAGKLEKRAGRLPRAINSTFLVGAGVLFMAGAVLLLSDVWPAKTGFYMASISAGFFVALYVLKNIRRPLNVGYITEQVPETTTASAFSVESLLKTAIAAVLAPLVGYVADSMGIGVGLAVLSVLLMIFYPLCRIRNGRDG